MPKLAEKRSGECKSKDEPALAAESLMTEASVSPVQPL